MDSAFLTKNINVSDATSFDEDLTTESPFMDGASLFERLDTLLEQDSQM